MWSSLVGVSIPVSLLAAMAMPAVAQRVPDVQVTTNDPTTGFASEQQIATDGGDGIFVVWADARAHATRTDIHFNRSLDGGATWLVDDKRISLMAAGRWISRLPAVAVSGSSVYVAWVESRLTGTNVYFTRSLDRGTTWRTTDQRINTQVASGTAHEIRVFAVGPEVWVSWTERSSDIYLSRSLDGGTHWTTPVRVDSDPSTSFNHEMAVAPPHVYLVWSDHRHGGSRPGDIYFNRSSDGGATWLPAEIRINTNASVSTTRSANPTILARGTMVAVGWEDSRNGEQDIYFNRSLDAGTTWLAQERRLDTDPPGASYSLRLALAAEGSTVHATWQDNRGGVFYSRSLDGGAAWLASDVRLDNGTVGGELPSIATLAGSVFVAWSDWRHNAGFGGQFARAVYYNHSLDGGSTWLPVDRRLNTGATPGQGEVRWVTTAAAANRFVAAWPDGRTGTLRIYANTPFGTLPYGNGTAGTGALAPQIDATGPIATGQITSIDVTSALGGAPAALLLGTGPASRVSTPLLGGTLHVLPSATLPLALSGPGGVPGTGTAQVVWSIPPQPTLAGLNINAQVLVLDGSAPGGVAMSPGLELWIG